VVFEGVGEWDGAAAAVEGFVFGELAQAAAFDDVVDLVAPVLGWS
jgi:hypothetical protein